MPGRWVNWRKPFAILEAKPSGANSFPESGLTPWALGFHPMPGRAAGFAALGEKGFKGTMSGVMRKRETRDFSMIFPSP